MTSSCTAQACHVWDEQREGLALAANAAACRVDTGVDVRFDVPFDVCVDVCAHFRAHLLSAPLPDAVSTAALRIDFLQASELGRSVCVDFRVDLSRARCRHETKKAKRRAGEPADTGVAGGI